MSSGQGYFFIRSCWTESLDATMNHYCTKYKVPKEELETRSLQFSSQNSYLGCFLAL